MWVKLYTIRHSTTKKQLVAKKDTAKRQITAVKKTKMKKRQKKNVNYLKIEKTIKTGKT